jgi:hypothetical protein
MVSPEPVPRTEYGVPRTEPIIEYGVPRTSEPTSVIEYGVPPNIDLRN